jgi:opine dehydrogenase
VTCQYSVIGAGNGGTAMAAELALLGREPILFEAPQFESRIRPLRDIGGINVESRIEHFPGGRGTHFAPLPRITTDLREAALAAIVVVVVPGQHHEALARSLAPLLRPGQLVLLNPGGVGGSLIWAQALEQAGVRGVLLAQAADLSYAGYRTPEAKVIVGGKKQRVLVGIYPGRDQATVMDLLAADFPEFSPSANALEAGLQGPGMLVHPLPMLMNAVRIDRDRPFTYDSYDITPSVAKAVEALDRERMAIVSSLGGEVKPIERLLAEYYGVSGATFLETVLKVPAYQHATAPADFTHRYIAEEVPTHLVPAREIAQLLGIPTPVMNATVALASAVNGEDYGRTGWTLAKLGLGNVDPSMLRVHLRNGL